MSQNILVTGRASYIGSHACVALLEAGHRVTVPGVTGDSLEWKAERNLPAIA